jgi:hypothetical protein
VARASGQVGRRLGSAWYPQGGCPASVRASSAKRLQSTTVPRNATLIGATAMTALVGRVPVQGQVRDPMPFKVITGADNLAANGLTSRT